MQDAPDPDTRTATRQAHGHKDLTWKEEIEVSGEQLVSYVKRLAAEGKVRRLRLSEPDGDLVVEVPLTIGVIAGGAVVLAAPVLAVLGAVAAFLTKVKLEIVRDGAAPDASESDAA